MNPRQQRGVVVFLVAAVALAMVVSMMVLSG